MFCSGSTSWPRTACPQCGGARLQPDALAVKVADKTIAQVSALTATALTGWLQALSLPDFQQTIAKHILDELGARVQFVVDAQGISRVSP